MAYAAVSSLYSELIFGQNTSYNVIDRDSQEVLEFVEEEIKSLESIVTSILTKSTSSLDLEMGVAISKLHEVIRSHISVQTDPETGLLVGRLSTELQDLKQAFHSTIELLKKMEEEYAEQGGDEDDDVDAISSRIGFGAHNIEMVRSSPYYTELKRRLLSRYYIATFKPVSLVGLPGIGKTTLAMEISKDPEILDHFDRLVWVTVGRKYGFEEIVRYILAEADPVRSKMFEGADEKSTAQKVQECFGGKRYLVVLDDVRNKYMASHLRSISPFPNLESRVLLTTRIQQANPNDLVSECLTMTLLDKEQSWDLLREKVFGEKPCPFQLEEDGMKIAEMCRGLPLTIVTVADLLSKFDPENTPQYWSEVANKKNHQIFRSAYDKISKVLYSCYKDLTHLLKLCFLYMSVFPRDCRIPRSKIITMWDVDGFLQTNASKFPCPSALKCLEELVSNNLVLTHQIAYKITKGMDTKKLLKILINFIE